MSNYCQLIKNYQQGGSCTLVTNKMLGDIYFLEYLRKIVTLSACVLIISLLCELLFTRV